MKGGLGGGYSLRREEGRKGWGVAIPGIPLLVLRERREGDRGNGTGDGCAGEL